MCFRYKQQLSAGLRRERALEQKQVQVELEWQRRCEDIKAEHYLANEQLIQDLTQAQDQVGLSYIHSCAVCLDLLLHMQRGVGLLPWNLNLLSSACSPL